MADDFRVMTSGAFTAAHLALLPRVERLTACRVVTAATSIGTGENSLPNRLKRGEVADIVIVAEHLLRQFVAEGLVLSDGITVLCRSGIAMAVRAGAPKPDIGTVDALRKTLLAAESIGYSASESGKYYSGELVQRLGIAEQVLPKSRTRPAPARSSSSSHRRKRRRPSVTAAWSRQCRRGGPRFRARREFGLNRPRHGEGWRARRSRFKLGAPVRSGRQ